MSDCINHLVITGADAQLKAFSARFIAESEPAGAVVTDITTSTLPDGSLHYRFVTKYAPPKRWVETISRDFPLLTFVLEYFNFASYGHGIFAVCNGIVDVDEEKCWHEEQDEQQQNDPIARIRRSLGFIDES